MSTTPPAPLEVDWFDGRSARPRPALAFIEADALVVEDRATGERQHHPLASVRWPQPDRHGARILTLPDGGSLHCREPGAWTVLARRAGVRASFSERLRQDVFGALLALLLVVAAGFGLWRFGLPLAVDATLAVVPAAVDEQVGRAALASVDEQWLGPSRLPEATRLRLSRAFEDMRQTAAVPLVPAELLFRSSEIGPNAFALPGGTMVLTDELVRLADGDETMILGVLAHEYGHVLERHGMRLLLQSLFMAAVIGLATGDVGGLVGGAPLLMSQLAYSREHERRADEVSIRMLQASGRSPAAMAEMFARLAGTAGETDGGPAGVLFSTHPPTADRIARFEAAARY